MAWDRFHWSGGLIVGTAAEQCVHNVAAPIYLDMVYWMFQWSWSSASCRGGVTPLVIGLLMAVLIIGIGEVFLSRN
jgi:hypothetical protein